MNIWFLVLGLLVGAVASCSFNMHVPKWHYPEQFFMCISYYLNVCYLFLVSYFSYYSKIYFIYVCVCICVCVCVCVWREREYNSFIRYKFCRCFLLVCSFTFHFIQTVLWIGEKYLKLLVSFIVYAFLYST